LASTTTVRRRSVLASRLPTTKLEVVLPTPPLGLIMATVLARVTPGTERI
jgi:hypothetical protein